MQQRGRYQNRAKRLLAAWMAAVLVLGGLLIEPSASSPAVATAESVDELRAEKDALQTKQDELESQRAEAVDSLEQAEAEKALIEEQIELKIQEIQLNQQLVDEMNVKIEEKNYQIALQEQEIAEKEAAIATEYETLRQRLRSLSKANTVTTLLQLLMTSDGLTDYLVKVKMMQRISEENEQLMNELEAEMQAISSQKAALEAEKTAFEEERKPFVEAQTALTIAKQELDVLYSEKTVMTDKLNQDITHYTAALEEAEETERLLQAEIDRIIAESVGGSNVGAYISGSMYWPAPSCNIISSLFAFRWGSWHDGLDICGSGCYGTSVVAASDGVVSYAGWMGGYGYTVIINHGNDSRGVNITTVYAHMAWEPEVYEGSSVYGGQTIGYVGSTGYSTGPHLHFEVQENGVAVDPLSNGYLSTNGIIINESL